MIRAKFKVITKAPDTSGVIRLSAVYSTDPNHENKSFWDATPSGTIDMYISNPVAFGFFELGEEVYVDFSKAAKPVTDPE